MKLKPYIDFVMSTNKKAGVLVTYKSLILVGQLGYYHSHDIFKGSINRGETPIKGALRELYEESGLKLTESEVDYLGKFLYERKELSLYHYELPKFRNANTFHCKSMVPPIISPTGKSYPEFISFKWIPLSSVTTYLNLNMSKIVNDAFERFI